MSKENISIKNTHIIWRIHDLQNGRRRFSFCYLIIRYISLRSCLFKVVNITFKLRSFKDAGEKV